MLTIRFNRTGKKNKAQFRIVVQEHTVAPGGRHIEIVGSWDPHLKKGIFKDERIQHWIEKGAQVSDSVYNLLVKKEIISGKKRIKKIESKNNSGKKSEASAEPKQESGAIKEKTKEAITEKEAK